MQYWQKFQQIKENTFFDLLIYSLVLLIAFLIILSPTFFFGTRSTEISCIHSTSGTDCSTIISSLFFKSKDAEIHNPIAIDLQEYKDGKDGKSCKLISAKAKFQDSSQTRTILSGNNCEAIKSIARELDTFFQSPNISSYYRKYP
jgi:hypothetical protein